MTIIIAEAGVNHNGSIKKAFKLVDAAKKASADIVKFQKFYSEDLASSLAKKANYQKINTNADLSQLKMLSKLELSDDEFVELKYYCDAQKIEFLASAFDHRSLEFLISKLGLKKLKIASGEINNDPFLLHHSKYNCDIILSTGMSNIEEIKHALSVLAYGYLTTSNAIPSKDELEECFNSKEGKTILETKVSLLHCTSEYPTSLESVNLRAMQLIRETFNLNTGYSDHTIGFLTSIAAAAQEAHIIEKHFTIDKNLEGPDHKSSLDPEELRLMCGEIRKIEKILGTKKKIPTSIELENLLLVRKSIIAIREIKIGEKFTENNIGIKRPGTGISPQFFWHFLGKKSKKNYLKDDLIS